MTFSSSATDPTAGSHNDDARSISFKVSDGVQASNSLSETVALLSPAPTLSGSSAASTYHAAGAAVGIAAGLAVTDFEANQLTSAAVEINGGWLAGDQLNFTSQNGITGSYNANTGILTLSGTASLAAYQAALDSVTFSSTATDPTSGNTDTARTVSFQVNDGMQASNGLSETVSLLPPSPPAAASPAAASSSAAAAFTAAPNVDRIERFVDLTRRRRAGGHRRRRGRHPGHRKASQLQSATVSITGGFLAGDQLNFTSQSGITGSYNAATGVLTLNGAASFAAYQTALDSVTYSSTATDPTSGNTDAARTIAFQVNDGIQPPTKPQAKRSFHATAASATTTTAASAASAVFLLRRRWSAPQVTGTSAWIDLPRRRRSRGHRQRRGHRRRGGDAAEKHDDLVRERVPRRRSPQLHQPERHHRQLQRLDPHPDAERDRLAGGVPDRDRLGDLLVNRRRSHQRRPRHVPHDRLPGQRRHVGFQHPERNRRPPGRDRDVAASATPSASASASAAAAPAATCAGRSPGIELLRNDLPRGRPSRRLRHRLGHHRRSRRPS